MQPRSSEILIALLMRQLRRFLSPFLPLLSLPRATHHLLATHRSLSPGSPAVMAQPRALPPPTKISFLTDIEGNWDYVTNYLAFSKGVQVDAEGNLELKDDFHFVFGGDAGDKGPYTLK